VWRFPFVNNVICIRKTEFIISFESEVFKANKGNLSRKCFTEIWIKKEYLKITLFNAATSNLFGLSCVSHENDAGMYNEIISILTIFSRFSAPELAQGGDCGAVLEAHFHVLFARHCYSWAWYSTMKKWMTYAGHSMFVLR